MTLDDIKKILNEKLSIKEELVTLEKDITKDLGVDSIDAIDLIMTIEENYNIRFDDEKIPQIKTIAEFIDYANSLINNK